MTKPEPLAWVVISPDGIKSFFLTLIDAVGYMDRRDNGSQVSPVYSDDALAAVREEGRQEMQAEVERLRDEVRAAHRDAHNEYEAKTMALRQQLEETIKITCEALAMQPRTILLEKEKP